MDGTKYQEAARRVVDDDGPAGVAVLMADHERLLLALRSIYDEGAPRQIEEQGRRPSEVISTMRDLALSGLKLPEDVKVRISVATVGTLAEAAGLAVTSDMRGEATEERPEDALRRIAGELVESREAEQRLADELADAVGRCEALEAPAVALVRHLSDAWWVEAAAALNELHRLTVDRETA